MSKYLAKSRINYLYVTKSRGLSNTTKQSYFFHGRFTNFGFGPLQVLGYFVWYYLNVSYSLFIQVRDEWFESSL